MPTKQAKKLSKQPLSHPDKSGRTLSSSGESNKVSLRLSLEPYKGTRDFYPKDMFIQNYIFDVWKKTARRYGYQEYNSSILEETDLYRAKTGEEIVNEQTYSFRDRGERDVTIRPEMTPTVARMVARKRKELVFPLRWFSIPNLWRYERPQRGRLREHWQLNCDIFGVDGIDADVEIISLAYDLMKEFGAKDKDFEIRVNNRRSLSKLIQQMNISQQAEKEFRLLLDKKNKITDFEKQAEKILGQKAPDLNRLSQKDDEIKELVGKLSQGGIKVKFDPYLVRGFDYYTGIVFEIYDLNPKNHRSLFGGGRYDDLVSIFGAEKVAGVGFGMGDVTIRDFLETYNLLPEYKASAELYIAHLDGYLSQANVLASYLRKQGVSVEVDLTERKVAAQIKTADREKIPFVLVVGEEEVKNGKYKLKNLKTGKEVLVSREDMHQVLKNG